MSENLEIEVEEADLFEHYRFKADPGQEVVRIDKFLLDRMADTSRNKIQVAAKNGNIHVNGQAVKQNYRVKPGDEIAIVLPYPVREIELIAQDIPIDVAYEDDDLLVVNKGSWEPNTFSMALYSVKSPLIVPGACMTIASTSDKSVVAKAIFIDF